MSSKPPRAAMTAIVLAVVTALALGALAWRDTRKPVLHEVIVPVQGLSREIRVLHASDLHSSRFGEGQGDLARLLAGEERFDAAVLTGDLVVRDERDDVDRAVELAEVALAHSDAVFFYPGNHDGPELASALAASGVHDLADWSAESRMTTIAPDAGSVVVSSIWEPAEIGQVDLLLLASHYPLAPGSLESMTTGPGRTTVILAGHTHGGQIRLPLIGALVAPRPDDSSDVSSGRPSPTDWLFPDLRGFHVKGLYGGDGVYQHVSAGLGTHALPLRFGPRTSMTVLRFVPESGGSGAASNP